jgi:hypothetical protein
MPTQEPIEGEPPATAPTDKPGIPDGPKAPNGMPLPHGRGPGSATWDVEEVLRPEPPPKEESDGQP